jgi:hypothetical protein
MLRLSAAADKLLSTSLRIGIYELIGSVEVKHKSGYCHFHILTSNLQTS